MSDYKDSHPVKTTLETEHYNLEVEVDGEMTENEKLKILEKVGRTAVELTEAIHEMAQLPKEAWDEVVATIQKSDFTADEWAAVMAAVNAAATPKKATDTNPDAKENNEAITAIQALESHLMARSKVFKEQGRLISKEIPGQLDVGGYGKKNAKITAEITTTDGKPLPITAYDREVQNVIGTLVKENGPGIYTPEQIFRELAGLQGSAKVTTKSAQEITEAVLKMSQIHCKIDMTEQFENHMGQQGKARFQGALVVADVCTAEYNGQEAKTAFKIYRLPILFAYSEKISQVTRVKRRLLDTTMNENTAKLQGPQKTRNNSRSYILLKRYIAQEISTMRGKTGRSNRLRYDTMAQSIDIPEPTRIQLRTIRSDTDYYLKFLQSMGEIKGFSEYKSGRAFVGVEIYL